jgi:hypothetical protein
MKQLHSGAATQRTAAIPAPAIIVTNPGGWTLKMLYWAVTVLVPAP